MRVAQDIAQARAAERSFDAALIASRLRPPQADLQVVRRSALLRLLGTSATPVVALVSPGGYGKTIALAHCGRVPSWPEAADEGRQARHTDDERDLDQME